MADFDFEDRRWLGIWLTLFGLVITLAAIVVLWGILAAAMVLGPLLLMAGVGILSGRPV